jgi:CheY-like chemotaxis protein
VLLVRLGHEVRVAVDGRSASPPPEILPDLVLCDISLPGGMDGYAVAMTLRSETTTQNAYLVAVTGHGQDDDRRRAAEAGFQQHLIKPVHIADLQRLLSQLAKIPATTS